MARAGAVTCAELLATATPAVLIPSPNVAEDHQTANAREMERAGAYDGVRGELRAATTGRAPNASSERCGRWWGTTRGFAPWRIPRRRATRRTPRRKSRRWRAGRDDFVGVAATAARDERISLLRVASQLAEPGVTWMGSLSPPRASTPPSLVRERVEQERAGFIPDVVLHLLVYFLAANTARSASTRRRVLAPRPQTPTPRDGRGGWRDDEEESGALPSCRNTCPL